MLVVNLGQISKSPLFQPAFILCLSLFSQFMPVAWHHLMFKPPKISARVLSIPQVVKARPCVPVICSGPKLPLLAVLLLFSLPLVLAR
jgi:hypothetical protein